MRLGWRQPYLLLFNYWSGPLRSHQGSTILRGINKTATLLHVEKIMTVTLCAPKIQNSVHFQNLVSPEIFCYSGCFHRILHKILHNIGHRGPMIQQSFLQCLYSVKMHEIFFKRQNYVSIKSFTAASEICSA